MRVGRCPSPSPQQTPSPASSGLCLHVQKGGGREVISNRTYTSRQQQGSLREERDRETETEIERQRQRQRQRESKAHHTNHIHTHMRQDRGLIFIIFQISMDTIFTDGFFHFTYIFRSAVESRTGSKALKLAGNGHHHLTSKPPSCSRVTVDTRGRTTALRLDTKKIDFLKEKKEYFFFFCYQ